MTWDETERFFDDVFEICHDLGLESPYKKIIFAGLQYGQLAADRAFVDQLDRTEGSFREAVVGVLRCNLKLDAKGEVLFSTWALAGFRLQISQLMALTIGARS